MALIREHFSLLGLENKVMVSFKQPYCLYSHPKDERKRLGLEGTETYEPHEAFFLLKVHVLLTAAFFISTRITTNTCWNKTRKTHCMKIKIFPIPYLILT